MGKGSAFGISALGISALVCALLLAAVYWVGWPLVQLAFFDPQRSQPMVVLDLVEVDSAERYDARYAMPMSELVASEGGTLLPDYELVHLLEGRAQHEWRYLSRLQFDPAQDVVQLMTSSPFRLLSRQAGVARRTVAGAFTSIEQAWQPALVVWLAHQPAQDIGDAFWEIDGRLPDSGARKVMDEELQPLHGESRFNRIYVLDFPSVEAAKDWLRSAPMISARALVNAQVDELALGVYARRRLRQPASPITTATVQ